MKSILFNLLTILLMAFISSAQNSLYFPKEDLRAIEVDSAYVDSTILALMASQYVPGVSALIVRGSQIIWEGQYGFANLEENRLVADSTVFNIASTSKPATGTALMRLWEQGYFDLDDDINDYLPYVVANPHCPGTTITFRMLLTHTSSILFNSTILSPLAAPGDPTIPLDEFTEGYFVPGGAYYSTNNYSYSQPGRSYVYSSMGVTLVGYLVEVLSGMTFEDYCQTHIFLPLGMSETSWFLANLDTNNIAMPYDWNGQYLPYGHMGRPWYPAGQLRTSAPHLARMLIAYMQGGIIDTTRILEEATVDSMLTLQCPSINSSIGLIWFHEFKAGAWVWRHPGNTWGARAVMSFCPEDSFGVIVLANGESEYLRDTVEELLYQFAREMNGVDERILLEMPETFTLSVYPNPFNSVITIEIELPAPEKIEIELFNIKGEMKENIQENLGVTGLNRFNISCEGYASGVYFIIVKYKDLVKSQKLVLVK